jgi:hypothetical protein
VAAASPEPVGVTVPELDRAKLQPLVRVGDGGQGVVFFTDAVKINGSWPVAYKEYRPQTQFNVAALREMVAFVPGLRLDDGRWLCEATAWPAALISRGGTASGLLMRRIPDRFRRPWGDGGADVPAALQYLLNPQAYLDRKGISLDDRLRLLILESVADTMARLHSLGIVVGDLSPNNLLVDLSAWPSCFFIDCDAMRLHGGDVLAQVETPEWEVPRPGREPIATQASDAYKFGLLAVRLFAQDQMGRDRTALAAAWPALDDLARRSLDANSTRRPAPGDWLPALRAAGRGSVRVTIPAPQRPTPIRPAPVPSAPVAGVGQRGNSSLGGCLVVAITIVVVIVIVAIASH